MVTKKMTSEEELKGGYIRDFISGEPVIATLEEIQTVQVFAQRLGEDYGYPKSYIQTQPQHRVRKCTSDEDKSCPVDIAVFRSSKKTKMISALFSNGQGNDEKIIKMEGPNQCFRSMNF